jgi:hypothetical protein
MEVADSQLEKYPTKENMIDQIVDIQGRVEANPEERRPPTCGVC